MHAQKHTTLAHRLNLTHREPMLRALHSLPYTLIKKNKHRVLRARLSARLQLHQCWEFDVCMVGCFLCAAAARLLAHGAPIEGAREKGGGGGGAHPRDVRQAAACQKSRSQHHTVWLGKRESARARVSKQASENLINRDYNRVQSRRDRQATCLVPLCIATVVHC